MAVIDYADTIIQTRLRVFTTALDAGAGEGKLLLMSGQRPAQKGGTYNPNQVLATFTFPKPSAAAISGSVLSLSIPSPVLASNSGIPTWARFTDSTGAFVADCDAGLKDSGKPVTIDQASVYAGGQVSVLVASLSEV